MSIRRLSEWVEIGGVGGGTEGVRSAYRTVPWWAGGAREDGNEACATTYTVYNLATRRIIGAQLDLHELSAAGDSISVLSYFASHDISATSRATVFTAHSESGAPNGRGD